MLSLTAFESGKGYVVSYAVTGSNPGLYIQMLFSNGSKNGPETMINNQLNTNNEV